MHVAFVQSPSLVCVGEKMTDDEVDALLSGIEDSQGQVNYEGSLLLTLGSSHMC